MIILGVDPGSLRTGYGAIETDGRRHRLLEQGALAPPARRPLPERLSFVHLGVARLIERIRPDVLAVEDVFHAANTRSALVLGHVRGVILLAGAFEPLDEARARKSGSDGVLVKPFEPQMVVARVRELLSEPVAARPDGTALRADAPART